LAQTNDDMPSTEQDSLITGIAAFSSTVGAVDEVAAAVVDVGVSSPPSTLKARATITTPKRIPLIASAARTPAVAWTAGRGAVGRGAWLSRAPHSSQCRFDEGFAAPQEGHWIEFPFPWLPRSGRRFGSSGGSLSWKVSKPLELTEMMLP
jgi:hypothetical protein